MNQLSFRDHAHDLDDTDPRNRGYVLELVRDQIDPGTVTPEQMERLPERRVPFQVPAGSVGNARYRELIADVEWEFDGLHPRRVFHVLNIRYSDVPVMTTPTGPGETLFIEMRVVWSVDSSETGTLVHMREELARELGLLPTNLQSDVKGVQA